MGDKGGLRFLLAEAAVSWKKTLNPVYVWKAIAICEQIPEQYPTWVRKYLSGWALGVVAASLRPPKEVDKELPWIFRFAKPSRAKGGRGSYFSDAFAEEEDAFLAASFASAIRQGKRPYEARTIAAENNYQNPDDYPNDDTLRDRLARHFGLEYSPKSNAEWRKVIDHWAAARMSELIAREPAPSGKPDQKISEAEVERLERAHAAIVEDALAVLVGFFQRRPGKSHGEVTLTSSTDHRAKTREFAPRKGQAIGTK